MIGAKSCQTSVLLFFPTFLTITLFPFQNDQCPAYFVVQSNLNFAHRCHSPTLIGAEQKHRGQSPRPAPGPREIALTLDLVVSS